MHSAVALSMLVAIGILAWFISVSSILMSIITH